MPLRAITSPSAPRYALTNIAIASAGGQRVLSLNRGRTTFYGTRVGGSSARNIITRSTDGGANWTDVQTTALPAANYNVNGMIERPDGEVLISTSSGLNGTQNYIYKSSGWATNPLTATWVQVLQFQGGLTGYPRSFNDQCMGSDGTVVIAECGGQTQNTGITVTTPGSGYTTITLTPQSGSGADIRVNLDPATGAVRRVGVLNGGTGHSPTSGTFSFNITGDGTGAAVTYTVSGGVITAAALDKARRLYVSTDFGDTWNVRYDLYLSPDYKYGPGLHWHGVTYDQDWGRIWATFGDNTGAGYAITSPTGTGKTQVMYSDDKGLTWTFMDSEPYYPGQVAQYTPVRATKWGVMFGGDAMKNLGITVFSKAAYRVLGGQMFGPSVYAPNHVEGTFRSAWSADDSMPIFLGYNSQSDGYEPVILVTDNGYNWRELWRETDLVTRPATQGYSCEEPFGPDTSGRVIANYPRPAGGDMFLRATMTGV